MRMCCTAAIELEGQALHYVQSKDGSKSLGIFCVYFYF